MVARPRSHTVYRSVPDGRAALTRARGLAGGQLDATDGLDRLGVVERTVDADSNRARGELEMIRVAFRDWSCMPEPLHQRFHAALPPSKSRGGVE